MFMWAEVKLRRVLLAGLGALTVVAAVGSAAEADKFPGIGRPATSKEVAAWNIDVRPDFQGLPKGSGSVERGSQIWEDRCASCHGSFGESNQVFTPIIGGTTRQDIESGHVATLVGNSQPQRTTMMKLSQVSTLWDYIHRAMPWNAPKSLSVDEVYAVTAYILNMAEIVPDDFMLSNDNIAEVQKRLPNRNGLQTKHGMWEAKGKPDTHNIACMHDCESEVKVVSRLPDYARNAHGNLAEQNRIIGAVRGTNTAGTDTAGAGAADTAKAESVVDGLALSKKYACLACHSVTNKVVGPAFRDVQQKYASSADAQNKLVAKVKTGGAGSWGSVPMPPNQAVPEEDVQSIVKWILAGAK
jgi:cytochrome c